MPGLLERLDVCGDVGDVFFRQRPRIVFGHRRLRILDPRDGRGQVLLLAFADEHGEYAAFGPGAGHAMALRTVCGEERLPVHCITARCGSCTPSGWRICRRCGRRGGRALTAFGAARNQQDGEKASDEKRVHRVLPSHGPAVFPDPFRVRGGTSEALNKQEMRESRFHSICIAARCRPISRRRDLQCPAACD